MAPPEVILDRFVKTRLRNDSGFAHYIGKLDIEKVESPSFRSLLYLVQETMNEALRLEGVNASGGVEHPPFHFDYFDVSDGVSNAHAFQHGGFSFIVVTLPMVELLWHLSRRLTPLVIKLLRLDSGTVVPDVLQGLLAQIQLNFLLSHEYTHHIHRHCVEGPYDATGMWNEFSEDSIFGNIDSQAQELDADGYACYLVLAHLLRGERRDSALAALGPTDADGIDGDKLLISCFFLAVMAFFCAFWQGDVDISSLYQFRHPPPPVRIKYMIQVTEMWCGQNGSVPHWWFSPARLQELFHGAAEVIGGTTRQTWSAQMSFLRSADGSQYDGQLFERFEALRKKRDLLSNAA